MALAQLNDGDTVYAVDWNNHVNEINTNTSNIATNTSDISSNAARITTLENNEIPKCVLRKNVNQSIPDAADTPLTWEVVETDTGSMASGDTIVIPETGDYLVVAQANIAKGGTEAGDCVLYVAETGTVFIGDRAVAAFGQPSITSNDTGGLGNGLSTATVRHFTQGTTLEVVVYQQTGSARDARATKFGGCTFAVTRVG